MGKNKDKTPTTPELTPEEVAAEAKAAKKAAKAAASETTEAPAKGKKDKGAASGSQFEKGAPTSNVKIADHLDELILFTPLSVEEDIVTENGTTDAIKANVVFLNEKKPEKSEDAKGILIFQRVLQSQLGDFVGKRMVLGRLVLGVKKPGKNAPYMIADPTPGDVKVAEAYLASIDPFNQ